MANLVRLLFELVVECNYDYADDLGEDIARDLLCEQDNGDNHLEWNYIGSKKLL